MEQHKKEESEQTEMVRTDVVVSGRGFIDRQHQRASNPESNRINVN